MVADLSECVSTHRVKWRSEGCQHFLTKYQLITKGTWGFYHKQNGPRSTWPVVDGTTPCWCIALVSKDLCLNCGCKGTLGKPRLGYHPTDESPVPTLKLSRSLVAGKIKEKAQVCGQYPGSERKERLLGWQVEPDPWSDSCIQLGVP